MPTAEAGKVPPKPAAAPGKVPVVDFAKRPRNAKGQLVGVPAKQPAASTSAPSDGTPAAAAAGGAKKSDESSAVGWIVGFTLVGVGLACVVGWVVAHRSSTLSDGAAAGAE